MKHLEHLTLLDTLEADRVFAVLDDGQHVPGGEPGHRHVVDLQQQLVLGQLPALEQTLPRPHLAEVRELAVLRAPLQLEAQLPVLPAGYHRFVDFVGPVVLLLEALRHVCFLPPPVKKQPPPAELHGAPGSIVSGPRQAQCPLCEPRGRAASCGTARRRRELMFSLTDTRKRQTLLDDPDVKPEGGER